MYGSPDFLFLTNKWNAIVHDHLNIKNVFAAGVRNSSRGVKVLGSVATIQLKFVSNQS